MAEQPVGQAPPPSSTHSADHNHQRAAGPRQLINLDEGHIKNTPQLPNMTRTIVANNRELMGGRFTPYRLEDSLAMIDNRIWNNRGQMEYRHAEMKKLVQDTSAVTQDELRALHLLLYDELVKISMELEKTQNQKERDEAGRKLVILLTLLTLLLVTIWLLIIIRWLPYKSLVLYSALILVILNITLLYCWPRQSGRRSGTR
ncbi:hypothetical protein F4779DRAFT_608759 [Xylariaceae sp. FL0662B]|nr:hypothetical protein F4779DRAFT_608759 [Xylariaceae sp. FL0662B]